ncbi:CAM kinase, putative, partial [Eimeria acervulina]
DIKPENILIKDEVEDGFYRVKVADFGLAKTIENCGAFATTMVGTPQYWAPEVINSSGGRSYGFAADLWSFGVCLFVFLGGNYPFEGSPASLQQLVLNGRFHFRHPRFSRVSEDAKNLIRRALVVDERKRITEREIFYHPWMTRWLCAFDRSRLHLEDIKTTAFRYMPVLPPLSSPSFPYPPPSWSYIDSSSNAASSEFAGEHRMHASAAAAAAAGRGGGGSSRAAADAVELHTDAIETFTDIFALLEEDEACEEDAAAAAAETETITELFAQIRRWICDMQKEGERLGLRYERAEASASDLICCLVAAVSAPLKEDSSTNTNKNDISSSNNCSSSSENAAAAPVGAAAAAAAAAASKQEQISAAFGVAASQQQMQNNEDKWRGGQSAAAAAAADAAAALPAAANNMEVWGGGGRLDLLREYLGSSLRRMLYSCAQPSTEELLQQQQQHQQQQQQQQQQKRQQQQASGSSPTDDAAAAVPVPAAAAAAAAAAEEERREIEAGVQAWSQVGLPDPSQLRADQLDAIRALKQMPT